jgi:hypothetical protein
LLEECPHAIEVASCEHLEGWRELDGRVQFCARLDIAKLDRMLLDELLEWIVSDRQRQCRLRHRKPGVRRAQQDGAKLVRAARR